MEHTQNTNNNNKIDVDRAKEKRKMWFTVKGFEGVILIYCQPTNAWIESLQLINWLENKKEQSKTVIFYCCMLAVYCLGRKSDGKI